MSETVLVVEDQPEVRGLIIRILGDQGFTVLGASNANQGLMLFRQHHARIRLVIVDMVMPGMSGLDLAAELNRTQPDVGILYISGYTDSIVIESLQRHSPHAVLNKPFTAAALVDRVMGLLHAT